MTKFEVQTDTLCQGWVNCWSVIDAAGERPETFESLDDARRAIVEYIDDKREAHDMACKDGIFPPDEVFDAEGELAQLRIVNTTTGEEVIDS